MPEREKIDLRPLHSYFSDAAIKTYSLFESENNLPHHSISSFELKLKNENYSEN